jgi:hypothetical protein
LGPLEHAGIFRFFKFVVTHRFHDSVFSFKNEVPVVACYSFSKYSNFNGESKYTNLFTYFGYESEALINLDNPINGGEVFDKCQKYLDVYSQENVRKKLCDLADGVRNYIRRTVC